MTGKVLDLRGFKKLAGLYRTSIIKWADRRKSPGF